MAILLAPISILTFGKTNMFAYSRKNLSESLPYISLQFITSYVWISTGLYFLLSIQDEANASHQQWFIHFLLGDAYYLDAIGIFIYTWTFLDVVIADYKG